MAWTTEDEIDYLKRIGLHGEGERPALQDRIQLIKNYIAAAKLRANWGEMDKSSVLSFARQKLTMLELKAS